MVLMAAPVRAIADSIVVNSTEDNAAVHDGQCTLREAMTNANQDSDTTGGDCAAGSGADTITFSVSGTILLGSTLPPITSTDGLTILSPSKAVIISGNNGVQVFKVNSGAALALEGLTITNGNNNDCGLPSFRCGGGLFNEGVTTITNSVFSDNIAANNGGIENEGILIVTNSTFSGNSAGGAGGIANNGFGMLTITNTTFSGNRGGSLGGGIFNSEFATATITNTTFSGNRAGLGGGINNQGTMTITKSLSQ
jgi:CSLREA domain-containing protein